MSTETSYGLLGTRARGWGWGRRIPTENHSLSAHADYHQNNRYIKVAAILSRFAVSIVVGNRVTETVFTETAAENNFSNTVHGCMVYTERAEATAVSRGTSHVTTKQCCKCSAPLRWIFKIRNKKLESLRITCDKIAVSLLEGTT